jgi:hypothetical protein
MSALKLNDLIEQSRSWADHDFIVLNHPVVVKPNSEIQKIFFLQTTKTRFIYQCCLYTKKDSFSNLWLEDTAKMRYHSTHYFGHNEMNTVYDFWDRCMGQNPFEMLNLLFEPVCNEIKEFIMNEIIPHPKSCCNPDIMYVKTFQKFCCKKCNSLFQLEWIPNRSNTTYKIHWIWNSLWNHKNDNLIDWFPQEVLEDIFEK